MKAMMLLAAVLLGQADPTPTFKAGDQAWITWEGDPEWIAHYGAWPPPERVPVFYQEKFTSVSNPTRVKIIDGKLRELSLVVPTRPRAKSDVRVAEKAKPGQKAIPPEDGHPLKACKVEILEGPRKGQTVMVGVGQLQKNAPPWFKAKRSRRR